MSVILNCSCWLGRGQWTWSFFSQVFFLSHFIPSVYPLLHLSSVYSFVFKFIRKIPKEMFWKVASVTYWQVTDFCRLRKNSLLSSDFGLCFLLMCCRHHLTINLSLFISVVPKDRHKIAADFFLSLCVVACFLCQCVFEEQEGKNKVYLARDNLSGWLWNAVVLLPVTNKCGVTQAAQKKKKTKEKKKER